MRSEWGLPRVCLYKQTNPFRRQAKLVESTNKCLCTSCGSSAVHNILQSEASVFVNSKHQKKSDLSELDCGVIVGARQAACLSISKTHLLGLSHACWVYSEKCEKLKTSSDDVPLLKETSC